MAHRPTAGLYLHGFLTQSYCSIRLNIIVACVRCYQIFLEHPDLFLTVDLAISYMAVPVWLLPLQLQMSSVENVSYYLYTCAIDI